MLRNSAVVNIQSQRKRTKFIKKLDSMNKRESLPVLSTKGMAKKKRKR
jgi:hypothetical protein